MELFEFYPSPGDLIKSELDVLNYLRREPYIKEEHSQFWKHANTYYDRNQGSFGHGFEFVSYFDVCHATMPKLGRRSRRQGRPIPNARLLLAVRIESNKKIFRNISYCLTVCRIHSARLTLLRKFHFDVAIHGENPKPRVQPHPIFHLQYCGKMVPEMAAMGCRETQLNAMHPWLSEPRIFFPPMSLALLIDTALREFPDERSKKFRGSNEWRGLVRRQERLVLRKFYKKCVEVIDDTKKNNRTLAEEFYVG